LKLKLKFSESPYSILCCEKVSSTARKKYPAESNKREVHFEKFIICETNMELGKLPSSRTKISEWKPFSSIKMLAICFFLLD